MEWTHDDGGRAEAGYKGEARDCTVRAIAIALGRPYQEVYDDMNAAGRKERKHKGASRSSARTGVYRQTTRRYLESQGWSWTPCMGIGTGCKVHLRSNELPTGRIIVKLSRHLAAVIDGVLHDISDCSRNGTRCVYGYWQAETANTKGTT